MPSLADDSGLEVDALGGAPGVYSARYGGEPRLDERNRQALLAALAGVAPGMRTGRFRCVLCLCGPLGSGQEGWLVRDGVLEGVLTAEPRGSSGFGYDPLFVPLAGEVLGAGEAIGGLGLEARDLWGGPWRSCPVGVKNLFSHRGRAMAALRPVLEALVHGRGTYLKNLDG